MKHRLQVHRVMNVLLVEMKVSNKLKVDPRHHFVILRDHARS